MNKQVHFFPSTYHTEETKIHDIAFANTSSSSSQYTLYTTGVAGIIHTYNITLPSTTATPEIALVSSLTASRIEDEIISVFSIDVNTANAIIAGLGDSTVSYIQHDRIVHVYHTNDNNNNNNELPSITKVLFVDDNVFTTGNSNGCVELYDIRTNKRIHSFKEQTEEISDIAYDSEYKSNYLLSSCIDGTLGVFDIRKMKLYALSDCIEDEINCMQIVKGGERVVCGTGEGNVVIFNWDWFGDYKDRIVGHPLGVLSMDKYTDNVLITGCEDGGVRVCTVYPKGVRGVICGEKEEKGKYKGFGDVNCVKVSEDKKVVVCVGDVNMVKVFNVEKVDFARAYTGGGYVEEEEEEDNSEGEKEGLDEDDEDEENEEEEDDVDEDKEEESDEEQEGEEEEEDSNEDKEGDDSDEDKNDNEISIEEKQIQKDNSNASSDNNNDDNSDSCSSFSSDTPKRKSKKVSSLGKKRKFTNIIETERRKAFFSDL
jgi:hypothetical protein